MSAEDLLFDELVRIASVWQEAAARATLSGEALAEFLQIDPSSEATPALGDEVSRDAVKAIVGVALKMAMCNVLAAFDGITEMVDHGIVLRIVDDKGNQIGEDLNYRFMGYLVRNGLYRPRLE